MSAHPLDAVMLPSMPRLGWACAAAALLACAPAPPRKTSAAASSPSTPACVPVFDPGDAFGKAGLEGVFVLRDEQTGCSQATDPPMADTGFRPQSTFKIANALIGLETGVIEGEHHLWKWDGAPRKLKDWEQDLELGGALKVSCVPCFQDVARRVGGERMRTWLHELRYGNEDVGGPIDAFWLDGGPLRITPRGQTELIHRLLAGETPVKPQHVELVFRLLEIEKGPGFTFRGKTGLGSMEGRAIGWLVGYAERDGHRFGYATFVRGRPEAELEAEQQRLMPLRRPLTRALLVKAGALP